MPDALPVLPLRDTVVYPLTVAPILVGQERSLRLVREAMRGSRLIVLVAQRSPERTHARPEDLHAVGTLALIHELTPAHEGTVRIVVQGLERVRILDWVERDPFLIARIERAPDASERGVEVEALARAVRERFHQLGGVAAELGEHGGGSAADYRQLAYRAAGAIPLTAAVRQELLETPSVAEKLRRLVGLLGHELAVRQLLGKITAETSEEMTRAQREQILRRQMEAIRRELGDADPEEAELQELRERLVGLALSEEARGEVERELDRLERIPSASPEHGIIRTYLDWIRKLPWGRFTGGPIDVPRARGILDEDHFDLEKVKDRILEYLAVKRLRDERQELLRPAIEGGAAPLPPPSPGLAPQPGPATPSSHVPATVDETRREPILCFVGPPGVGKTSLGQSIARAMGRRFVRISLGGIHDEAEVRGHRRTYIGAMPGRILQALARAEAADPVFMIDEVDKLGVGFHGDPSAALLEVLDPAQNHAFVDTYFNVPFDLSRVLFLCTANATDTIPAPLLDRMEVLSLAGYTDAEKLHIALRYLVPKQRRANGLREDEVVLAPPVIRRLIREHTREAGVRGLERELATVLRKVARRITEGVEPPIAVRGEELRAFLGPPRFFDEVAERIDRPGVATGLAWTPTGGEVLFVEAALMPAARERLVLTGMLGDVMRESARAALSYLRSNAGRLGIDPGVFERKTVHVHVPAGATPKDGPSAGVTLLAALASQALGRPVRNDLAMTGEITLRGKVLPVGGIKEKVLAAHRVGLRTVLLPRRSEGALEDVPDEIRREVEVVLIESADDLLAAVFPGLRIEAPGPAGVRPTPPVH